MRMTRKVAHHCTICATIWLPDRQMSALRTCAASEFCAEGAPKAPEGPRADMVSGTFAGGGAGIAVSIVSGM